MVNGKKRPWVPPSLKGQMKAERKKLWDRIEWANGAMKKGDISTEFFGQTVADYIDFRIKSDEVPPLKAIAEGLKIMFRLHWGPKIKKILEKAGIK